MAKKKRSSPLSRPKKFEGSQMDKAKHLKNKQWPKDEDYHNLGGEYKDEGVRKNDTMSDNHAAP
jgi:hypothetical protein